MNNNRSWLLEIIAFAIILIVLLSASFFFLPS
ncbi:hypothetical protein FHS21_001130 [Phyllobacterium trifolii]|jgi:hypothetical protein|uniref:Uncharacterized protein n=1 Tax=Phyllobacterium trifolii TaxID=300193 RepID=A0A839U946_9HYPH|nr:hypothetical protein [Phyllobacterium trifolii]